MDLWKQEGIARYITSSKEHKELEVALVKATRDSDSKAPKRKFIDSALASTFTASQPRTASSHFSSALPAALHAFAQEDNPEDLHYIIRTLLAKLKGQDASRWRVVLKTLLLLHIMLRESDWGEKKEFATRIEKDGVLATCDFMDRSSVATQELSAFSRVYGSFLRSKVKNINLVGFDMEAEPSESKSRTASMGPNELLQNLPPMQDELRRLTETLPTGDAGNEETVQVALIMTVRESFKLYRAVYEGMSELLSRFGELGRVEASEGLEVFRRGVKQTESLQQYYDKASAFEGLKRFQFPKLHQYPAEDVQLLEDYVKSLQSDTSGQEATPPLMHYKTKRQQRESEFKDKLQQGDAGAANGGATAGVLQSANEMKGAEHNYLSPEETGKSPDRDAGTSIDELASNAERHQQHAYNAPPDPFVNAGIASPVGMDANKAPPAAADANGQAQANGMQHDHSRARHEPEPMSGPSKEQQRQRQQQQKDPFSSLI